MRDHCDPWKWPAVLGLTAVLFFGGVFLIPRDWIRSFFSPLTVDLRPTGRPPGGWLVLVPPPEIEIETEDSSSPPPPLDQPEPLYRDPDWWRNGWILRTEEEIVRTTRPTPRDSVSILLNELELDADILTATRPDSVLAARLILLQRENSLRFDEMKPYLRAMTRARAYADIQSRAADMYDDFLNSEIMVPD